MMNAGKSDMARLEIRLLGSFEVRLDGRVVTSFESNKVRALLAYLAGEAPRPQPREKLAELLWPDWPPGAALSNLRYALADLRKCIGDREAQPPFLTISRQFLHVNVDGALRIDTLSFDQASGQGEPGSRQALEMYSGAFLEDFPLADQPAFAEWVLGKRAYYERKVLQLLLGQARACEERGEYELGLSYARRALAIEPWLEEAHQQAMRLLALSGQRGAALVQFEECKRLLRKELGVAPGEGTRRLVEQIVEGGLVGESVRAVAQDGPSTDDLEQIALESLRRPRHNLPAELTSFWGREAEIREIRDCFVAGSTRMVTLRGAGGIGKSRLALRAASELVEAFTNGVCWVGLAPVSDPDMVPRVVAKSLDLTETPGRSARDAVRDYLRSKHLLMVLDNCEHLIEACALLAQFLLMGCPKICILATSRERLGVEGERVIRVPSLTMPDENTALEWGTLSQFESVGLFVARAQTVTPGFVLTQENAQAVSAICRRLDGIPLAIELAVARLRVLTPTQIEQRLTDVFHLLTGGERTALPRHQSLRATIDWSYQMLPEGEQRLLQELSIFSGGWTLEAAEAVGTGDQVVDKLQQLVEKSLVIAIPGEGLRFTLLETIREFALERLTESGAEASARSRHLEYYLELAERVEPELRGPTQIERLNFLERELPNLRAAMEWGLKSDLEAELRLAGALMWFWHLHNRREEGLHWLDRGLDLDDCRMVLPPVIAKALAAAGVQRGMRMEVIPAKSRLLESIQIYRELGSIGRTGEAFALSILSMVECYCGNYRQGVEYAESAMAVCREVGTQGCYFESLIGKIINLEYENIENPEIRLLKEDMLSLALEEGDPDRIATAYTRLTDTVNNELDLINGQYLISQAAVRYKQVGNREMLSNYFRTLGRYAMLEGDYPEALRLTQTALEVQQEEKNAQFWIPVIFSLAEIFLLMGEYASAARYLADALSLAEKSGFKYFIAASHLLLGQLALLEGDFNRMALEFYQARYLERMAIYYYTVGSCYWMSGDKLSAEWNFKKALRPEYAYSRRLFGGLAVNGLACMAACNQPRLAARLFGAAEVWNPYLKNLLYRLEREAREEALTDLRKELGEDLLGQLWAEGRAIPLDRIADWVLEQVGGDADSG